MPEQPCPHVSPAMIAAGFLRCHVCDREQTPPAGFLADDTSRQEAALRKAYDSLGAALEQLAWIARAEGKVCGRKRPKPDLDRVRAAIRDLDLAENDVDSARGGHG